MQFWVGRGERRDEVIGRQRIWVVPLLVHQLVQSPFRSGVLGIIFDVDAKDGQRFIGNVAPDTSSLPLNVITNWTAELKRKQAVLTLTITG